MIEQAFLEDAEVDPGELQQVAEEIARSYISMRISEITDEHRQVAELNNQYNSSYLRKHKEEFSEDNLSKAESILERRFLLGMRYRSGEITYSDWQAQNMELNRETSALPYIIGREMIDDISREMGGHDGIDMREVVKFLVNASKIAERQAAIASVYALSSQLRQVDENLPTDVRLEAGWDTFAIQRRVFTGDLHWKFEHYIDEMMDSVDPKLLNFILSSEGNGILTSEMHEEIQAVMVGLYVNGLSRAAATGNDDLIQKYGYRLRNLNSEKTAPVALLEMWYRTGYSGAIYKEYIASYVSDMTPDELERLTKGDVKGVKSVVEAIQAANIAEEEPDEAVVGEAMHQICGELLAKGDASMKLYVLSLLADTREKIDDDLSKLIVNSARDMSSSSVAVALLGNIARKQIQDNNYGMGIALLGEINMFPRNIQESFGANLAGLLISAAIETQADDEILEQLAGVIGEKAETLKSVIDTISDLVKEGRPLHGNRALVINHIFSSPNIELAAADLKNIFTKRQPYWKQLMLMTQTNLSKDLAESTSGFPIINFPKVKLPKGEKLGSITQIDQFETRPVSSMTLREKRAVADLAKMTDEEVDALDSIPFGDLRGIQKTLVYGWMLSEVVGTSRDFGAQEAANVRNHDAPSSLVINEGSFLHGSSIDVISSVLLNGNLAGESLGQESLSTDSYPFHADFTRLTREYLESHASTKDILSMTLAAAGYGQNGELGTAGQVLYLFDRQDSNWHPGESTNGGGEMHALVLAGMPSTEISGIVLRDSSVTLESAKKAVLEAGFYIPIYDFDGTLIYSADEYDAAVDDNNLRIPAEIWDNSLKTGEQLGSNPGSEYTAPTESGATRFYVKFAQEDELPRLWNEHLANLLYETIGIAVPKTRVVKIEGSYGHASEIVDLDPSGAKVDLKDGFLADALLANWDAVFNPDNTGVANGRTIRLDAGGSLLFRARGERKTQTQFSDIVSEVELGTDLQNLTLGMRQMYPGLTLKDVQTQARQLRESVTDEVIDVLVDSVRLSKDDRTYLKKTLKARRDYILDWAEKWDGKDELHPHRPAPTEQLEETTSNFAATAEEAREKGKRVVEIISQGAEDEELKLLVPGWEKLNGDEGYQHNFVKLGQHIKDAVRILKTLPEYKELSANDKRLVEIATFFHDFGKPTGRATDPVPRDRKHEIPSADIAKEQMAEWGFSEDDIRIVTTAILHDGIVSDVTRGKGGENKDLSPQELAKRLGYDERLIKIIRALNTADVLATVGEGGFVTRTAYDQYWDEVLDSLGAD